MTLMYMYGNDRATEMRMCQRPSYITSCQIHIIVIIIIMIVPTTISVKFTHFMSELHVESVTLTDYTAQFG